MSTIAYNSFDYSFDYSSHNDIFICKYSPENLCNEQDVDPQHENRLYTVYNKLKRLHLDGDNTGKTMNSNSLINGLTFTQLDRRTMHTQIINAHPNMMFRFNNTNNPSTFTFSNTMSHEILDLFRPTNL
jgi:hypothetical protein